MLNAVVRQARAVAAAAVIMCTGSLMQLLTYEVLKAHRVLLLLPFNLLYNSAFLKKRPLFQTAWAGKQIVTWLLPYQSM